jgi:hypothetical protein
MSKQQAYAAPFAIQPQNTQHQVMSCSRCYNLVVPAIENVKSYYYPFTLFDLLPTSRSMQILKGGFIVAADLVRCLQPCPRGLVVEFVHVSRMPGPEQHKVFEIVE